MARNSAPEASIEQEFWEREFDAPVPPGARREARRMPPRPAFALTEYGGLLGRVVERMREWRDDARFGVVVLVVIAVVAGVVWYRIGISGGDDAVAAPNSSSAASAASAGSTTTSPETTTPAGASGSGAARTPAAGGSGAKLLVHVAGAVAQAGVVELAANARVTDAIKAAGGAQADGDLDRLNLAAKLTDGERVYVPRVGQADPGVLGGSAAGASSGTPGTPGTPINLNTATQAQLESLPGIGPVYAQAIIAERQARGAFKSVNELRNVRGIGEARFADLAPLVTV